jgi:hypothetical protein
MNDELTLVFRAGDEPFPIPARVEEVIESPHTGKTLRRLSTEITVPAARARAIATLLEAQPLVDEDGNEWSGRIESESYGEVQGLHHLKIGWEEQERVQANAIEFEGLSLKPSRYEERADDDGVAISLRARLTPAETEKVRDLQQRPSTEDELYFPVVRRGVSDEPRRMRFGRVLWQALEDGNADYDITLVDESLDKEPRSGFGAIGEPHTGHLLNAVEQLLGERDALLDALKSAGVLDDAAVERVHQAGAHAVGKRRYRFYQVDDLSGWD